jgi:DNA-binding CsgD family transcriptional regulator
MSDRTQSLSNVRPFDRSPVTELPCCSAHPGSFVRRYRSHGPNGPGVYPQCVPRSGEQPHLLSWDEPGVPVIGTDTHGLTPSEREVLEDAALGLSVVETARKRFKGTETVKTQRRSILLKLGAHNMAHAVGMTSFEPPAEYRHAA